MDRVNHADRLAASVAVPTLASAARSARLDQANRPLSECTALVTGATAGVGRATALLLASHGANVLVHGRDPGRGEAVVRAITSLGRKARFLGADLSELRQLRGLAQEASEADILVNNAGAHVFGATVDVDEPTFNAQIAINLRAPFFLVKELAPYMAARGFGSIVNMTTFDATTPGRGCGIYAAAKAGTELLTSIWADEFGPLGVRVNAVAARPTRTPGASARGDGPENLDRSAAIGRMAEPEEIANAIVFLSGPQASYINGAVLQVHGGIRAATG